jgi:hypothetical protein
MENTQFEKLFKNLRRASHYRSQTNPAEYISLNPTDKLIFTYMVHRYVFFKGRYFDKQGDIADECCVSLRTTYTSIKKFIDSGIFEVKKGAKSCISYEKINSPSLAKETKDGMEDLGTLQIPEFEKKKKVVKKVIVEVKPVYESETYPQHFDASDPFFTDSNCPF